jgi:xylulokinase
MDQAVGAIGAGNIHSGIISETTGAALAIQVTVADPMIDKHKSIPVYFHSVPNQYLLVPVCPTAGMAFKWFRDQFGQMEMQAAESQNTDSYDLMTKLAGSIPPGSDGLVMLPHLMGAFSPDTNPSARGSFTGFTLSHTRGHFVRALMEGVAFLLRRNVEFIEQVGIHVGEIVSTGGGSRSRLWNQIKANVYNKTIVTLKNEETALLGNVILSGVASGVFQSIADACQAMVAVKETFQPNQEMEAYIGPYRNYCEIDRILSSYYSSAYVEK